MGFIKKIFKPIIRAISASIPVLIALITLLLLAVLWWFGPSWQFKESYPFEPLMVRWAITMGVLLVIAIIISIYMRRKVSALQEELKSEEEALADPAKPILAALQRQYQRVLQELRSSIGKRNFIYALPWYIVIGAENSGKTSLINRSGQSYVQTNYSKSKRRNEEKLPYKIDWWISEDAVLIDPDGELISGNASARERDEANNYRDLPERIWDEFVSFLEQNRSRRPLNGVVLVIDLPSIMSMKASDRKSYAIVLRSKLRELIETLGTRLPVYIVMSKFDQLAGFEAFFDTLPNADREKVFGFTFAQNSKTENEGWIDELETSYGHFIDNLTEQTFDAIAKAPNQTIRNQLFSFNRQLAGIRETLVDFLSEVLDEDRYSTPAMVRGLYFTSVYQQGIPHNTFSQAVASSYGLPNRIEAAKAIKRSVTYFSQTLFQTIIYPEAGLAGDNVKVYRRKNSILWLNGILVFIIGVLFIGGWDHYYKVNVAAANVVVRESQAFEELRRENAVISSQRNQRINVTGYDLLQPLNQIHNAIAQFGNYREKLPIIADMGLYQGNVIGPKVEETYLNMLGTRFLPQLSVGLLQQITPSQNIEPQSDNILSDEQREKQRIEALNERLSALRVYRIIEDLDSRTNGDETRNESNKQIVLKWMENTWEADYLGINGDEQIELLTHLEYAMNLVAADLPTYLDSLEKEDIGANQLELLHLVRSAGTVVASAQRDLRTLQTSYRVYEGIKQDASIQLRGDVDLRQAVGGDFDIIYKQKQPVIAQTVATQSVEGQGAKALEAIATKPFSVPALFTTPAYKGYFSKRSKNVLDLAMIDEWVVGREQDTVYSDADRRKLEGKILGLYTNDYLGSWKRTLRQLEVKEFDDIEYAVQVLEALSGPEAPLQRLLATLKENSEIYPDLNFEEGTVLTEEQKKTLAEPTWREADRIRRNFSGLVSLLETGDNEVPYYEELIGALTNTYDYMAAIQSAPDRGKAALKAARDRFELDGADPLYVLSRVASGLPEPLSAQIEKVSAESWQVMLVKALGELENKWDRDVYSFYREKMAGRYPFAANASVDVALEDFEEMFGPEGRLSTFYAEYLKVFLEDNLDALYSEEDEDYLVKTDVLDQLEAAWAIQNGFFDTRGGLGVGFSLEPLALTANKRRSVIDIDGQVIPYNHGPTQSSKLIWPNTLREGAQSQLTLVGTNGQAKTFRFTGPWSWFRLLELSRINGANPNMIDVTFSLDKGQMRYRVRTEKSNSPIIHKLFKGFSLPRTLLRSSDRLQTAKK